MTMCLRLARKHNQRSFNLTNELRASSESSLSAVRANNRHALFSSMRSQPGGLKITRIQVFQVDLPLHEGRYKWSDGKFVEVFDATVVKLETNLGITGFGEQTPLGPAYLPAYAGGTRAGLRELAPHLIGLDPSNVNYMNQFMDRQLKGHPYVKSAIDMACWDILGKISGRPVAELLGGRFGESFPLYRAISQNTAEEMAANVAKYIDMGYRYVPSTSNLYSNWGIV